MATELLGATLGVSRGFPRGAHKRNLIGPDEIISQLEAAGGGHFNEIAFNIPSCLVNGTACDRCADFWRMRTAA